ncbi:MAG TPA: discoidin domain-containing protein [Kofleriaceae bacterium]|nr:discoidin domain-containing protein [Kofleriaceae bacterium]
MTRFESTSDHVTLTLIQDSLSRRIAPARSATVSPLHASALACALALMGCLAPDASEEAPPAPVVSWEEFRASVTRNIEGREIYVVEWDLAVTEEELRQRYEGYVARAQADAQAEHDGLGEVAQASIVNQSGGVDDIWLNNQQLKLTYCVSDAFGALKARAVAEMAQAAAGWQGVARVSFTYLPAHDANCSNANPNVTFSVRPSADGGGCAFFPSGGGCVARTLTMDLPALDANYEAIAPNMTTVGVFRHELGHILGLRHEQTRPQSGTCFENNAWRALSPYDQGSVMHYPWCNGLLASELAITPSDALGAALLYGGSVANLAAGRPASQSSTAHGGIAARAADGNTDGNFANSSVTHTNLEAQPWWQVDLGGISDIGEVVLYNRTDCCAERLANFDVQLSSDGVNWQNAAYVAGQAPAKLVFVGHVSSRFVRVRLRGTGELSLAEVQVKPWNLAAGKLTSQSSTYLGASASRAVDGNTDGNYSSGSVTHTNEEAQPWWQVDLGAVTDIGQVVLTNRTDCCSERLADFDLQVSSDAATWQTVTSFSGAAPARTPLVVRASGRYVRVRLRGYGILSLAEVEVFQARNLAAGKSASQSTTYLGASASRAIDGNTDGIYNNGSVTHTLLVELQPWWQVDLGSVMGVGDVVLYNRTDCCAERLTDFDIQLSNDGATWQNAAGLTGAAPTRSVFSIRASARYVRVRLRNLGTLSLAEVQIFAP